MKLFFYITILLFVSASAMLFFAPTSGLILKYASPELPSAPEQPSVPAPTPTPATKAEDGKKQGRPNGYINQVKQQTDLPFFPASVPVVGISAVKTVDKATATPGETLNYTVTISNPGTTPVTSLSFTDVIDPNTTLVNGSLKTSPIAADDSYSSLGNVGISVPAANGILANDQFGTNPAATFTAVTAAATTGGGTISIAADGSISYTPAAGFTGNDTYQYTLANDAGSSTGTITIAVANLIWFVNNNSVAPTEDGRLATPFKSITAFQNVNGDGGLNPAAGQAIFVYESATPYTGNITLLDGQKLIGQDATANLPAILGFTTPTYSAPALPVSNSGNATKVILTATGAAHVVALNGGASGTYSIRGLTIGDKATGSGISGSGFGTLAVSETSINGTGQALSLSTGTLNGSFADITSSSGASGIALATLAGTTTIDAGALGGHTGVAFSINGGTASVTYNGTVTKTAAGNIIDVLNKTGGTVDFNGAVSASSGSGGINLVSNTGATISFDGGLALSTGASPAFTATGGGTVSATQDNTTLINLITTTTATAVNVANTTIGAAGLRFRSINVNGATKGVILNTTGSGPFAITGTGTTAGSGGTIQNISLRGIEITGAQNISLSYLNLTSANTADGGGAGVCDETNIDGCNAALYIKNATTVGLTGLNITTTEEQGMNLNNVSGLTITGATVQGNGNAAEESALKARNLQGTCTISNSVFKNSAHRIAHIINTTGAVHLSVTNSSFINDATNTSLIKQDCFEMRTQSAGSPATTSTLIISGSTFKRAGTKGIQVAAEGNSVVTLGVTSSTVDREGTLMAGIEAIADATATMNANVDGNPLVTGDREVPLNIVSFSTAAMNATARNNIVRGGANPNLNAFATLRANGSQQSVSKVILAGNTVTHTDEQGILVSSISGTNTGSIDATVENNSVTTNNVAGNLTVSTVELRSVALAGPANNNCSHVRNNTVTLSSTNPVPPETFTLVTGSASSTLRLQGTGANGAAIWNNNTNSPTSPPAIVTPLQFPGSTIVYGGVTCLTPTNTTFPTSIVAADTDIETAPAKTEAVPLPPEEASTERTESFELSGSGLQEEVPLTPGAGKEDQPIASSTESVESIEAVPDVSVTGITLPAAKDFVIKFQVTVNSPFPDGVCTVSNQGSVSATEITTQLTDNDANAGNGINPTVTTINSAPSITACQDNITTSVDAGLCTASEAFAVTVKGCPAPTITYKIGAATITSPHDFPIGVSTVDVTVSNGVGTDATCQFTVTVTDAAPVVSSVSVPVNGTYIAGQNLDFTVNFDRNVLVTGTPQIALTVGAATRHAGYVSGSGTGALVFRYTVQAGDEDANGISVGALSLNGGTIQTSCSTAATLTLNSVGATAGVLVDAVVPTVTINQAAGQDDPTSATTINFTVVFSESVTGFATGDVSLSGTAGATTATVSGSGTTYTVAVTGMTADGTVIATIAAGKASDAAGNGNAASSSTDNTVTYVADAPPSVQSINRRSPSVALTNATTVTFRVTFSENVTGVDATDFTLALPLTGLTASIGTVSSSTAAIYDVQVTSIAGNGVLGLNLKASGTGIKDGINQDITGGFTGQTYTIDQTAPVVDVCPSDITQPAGSNCTATATWTAPLATDNVDGQISHSNSTHDPGASFSGTTTVSYTFHDQAGNETICSFLVTVQDNTAPSFSVGLSATPVTLWPPDHKLKTITLTYTTIDNCPGTVTNRITVSSTDPISGVSDGDKFPDWIILNDHSLQLRAERGNGREARVYTITVTPVDEAGNEGTPQTVDVRIAHNITAPVSGTSFKIGSTVSFAGVFWDKPGNRHTANWLIDGSTVVKGVVTEPSGTKNGKVTGSYKFGAAGVYKLQMNVIDQNKATSYVNTNEDLEAIVVIYDPNGGYTYGGGNFASPPGALMADPTATGKVSYGFTVNYFKGATLPKGETQMELKVGEFEFNALNFEYLSIAGARAQFKGSGRIIGGQSGINFIMTVIDGQLDGTGEDKVRIKIYNKNTGQVYYDNEPGIGEADNPKTKVAHGSQVVISGTPVQTGAAVTQTESLRENPGLQLRVLPNPTTSNFGVYVDSDNKTEKVLLEVFDLYGRRVERRFLTSDFTTGIGAHYSPGTYFIRVVQGNRQKEAKLLKLPH